MDVCGEIVAELIAAHEGGKDVDLNQIKTRVLSRCEDTQQINQGHCFAGAVQGSHRGETVQGGLNFGISTTGRTTQDPYILYEVYWRNKKVFVFTTAPSTTA
ncbi:hypothetical protein BC936DRAFT_140967 [Jimgerdemannia flammicorona]|uniref:ELP3-like N-terminal domain-containing protein n=1 Tax=Jimgerdemannia flammicorona TaxID=994334 RepID=A0A433DGM5_9FUNG|nr:hypothetical protein BC936DRAFT_140967 [Jimgerdemannia flammicorona]